MRLIISGSSFLLPKNKSWNLLEKKFNDKKINIFSISIAKKNIYFFFLLKRQNVKHLKIEIG